jgi:hypothetical protein
VNSISNAESFFLLLSVVLSLTALADVVHEHWTIINSNDQLGYYFQFRCGSFDRFVFCFLFCFLFGVVSLFSILEALRR